ncbi:MAG: hypothetical protein NC183_06960 [Corallococcus sp.]|nr:hypothetical protein [Corallococcus sp.]
MSKYLIDGNLYDPIKVRDAGDWDEGDADAVCGDCSAKYGEQHMAGCDIERCPVCGLQLLSCGHEVYEVADDYKAESEMN